MNADTGEIREMTREEIRAENSRLGKRCCGDVPGLWVPLTDREAAFFRGKGTAFRQLWAAKMARGLRPSERERLEALMTEAGFPAPQTDDNENP